MFQVFFRRLLPRLGGDDDSEEEEDEKKEKTKPVEKLSDGKQQKAEKTGCREPPWLGNGLPKSTMEGFYDFSTAIVVGVNHITNFIFMIFHAEYADVSSQDVSRWPWTNG